MSLAVQDGFGRRFELERPACRIVSLIPSITETLFILGAGDRVVGVSKFCTEPPEGVAAKATVGGQKNPRIEAIVALRPDLVIVNVEENRKRHVEAMSASGLQIFVTYPRTVSEGIRLIRDLGVLTGADGRAEEIVAACEAARAEAERLVAGRPPVRVFCPVWRKPYMTINRDTYIHDVLRTCGAENVFQDWEDRYPRVTLAEMAALNPDSILLANEPFPFGKEHLDDFSAFPDLAALRNGRIHFLDGKILSWYGPRIAESLRALVKILH